MADNIGSWRVLEKCGLRRVRTFYYPDADLMPGADHGDVVYELTRNDWTRLVIPAETEDRRPGHTS
jgi:RimJ/RimL family protein N-acetyltransferase